MNRCEPISWRHAAGHVSGVPWPQEQEAVEGAEAGQNDEARERSRAALLQAGADLVLEHATRNPFAALRLRGLCERAGYSTGAFYLHWATVQDYSEALARHLAEDDEQAFSGDFAALADLAETSADASALEAIARVADRDLQLLVDNPVWDAMELMNVTWGRTRFREPVARGYKILDHATGQIYGAVLARRGREPRPPFDRDRIGVVLQGLAEGFGLRHKIDPASVPESSETALGLYATAVAAVLAVLTRLIGDDASADQAIDALLHH